MNLLRNLTLAVAVTAIVVFLVTRDSSKTVRPDQAPKVTTSVEAPPKLLYDPADVTEVTWEADEKSLTLTKDKDRDWDWNVQRRLAILARAGENGLAVSKPQGSVTISVKGEKRKGVYDFTNFVWTEGAGAGSGLRFADKSVAQALFAEGILGFTSHTLRVCQPRELLEVTVLGQWGLVKKGSKWFIHSGSADDPAKPGPVQTYVERLCQINVDFFVAQKVLQGTHSPAVKFRGVRGREVLFDKVDDVYVSNEFPDFKSAELDSVVNTPVDELRDPSLEAGRIALDKTKTEQERIQAIRKIKEARSPEGIPALKALVNEKTDIDLYRYEAVDALAAIGTKEAYKIIADRLAQVGRSGFELRLARALANGMGRAFMSDERTEDSKRREEVRELLYSYRKNPAGE